MHLYIKLAGVPNGMLWSLSGCCGVHGHMMSTRTLRNRFEYIIMSMHGPMHGGCGERSRFRHAGMQAIQKCLEVERQGPGGSLYACTSRRAGDMGSLTHFSPRMLFWTRMIFYSTLAGSAPSFVSAS